MNRLRSSSIGLSTVCPAYYLLANLYAEPDFYKPDKLKEAADSVLTKEPKVHSTAIDEMRSEVREILKRKDKCEIKK